MPALMTHNLNKNLFTAKVIINPAIATTMKANQYIFFNISSGIICPEKIKTDRYIKAPDSKTTIFLKISMIEFNFNIDFKGA